MGEKRSLEDLSDHELLVRIAKKNTAAEHHRRIAAFALVIIAAVVVLIAVLVLPRLLSLLQNADAAAKQASGLLTEAQPAVDGLSKVDFDALNSAITDLQSAASALAKVTSIFN